MGHPTASEKDANWSRLIEELRQTTAEHGRCEAWRIMQERLTARPEDVRLLRQLAVIWQRSGYTWIYRWPSAFDVLASVPTDKVPGSLARACLKEMADRQQGVQQSRLWHHALALEAATEFYRMLSRSITTDDLRLLAQLSPDICILFDDGLLDKPCRDAARQTAAEILCLNLIAAYRQEPGWHVVAEKWTGELDKILGLLHRFEDVAEQRVAITMLSSVLTDCGQRMLRRLRARLHHLFIHGAYPYQARLLLLALGGRLR